jgi:hypothetical protein
LKIFTSRFTLHALKFKNLSVHKEEEESQKNVKALIFVSKFDFAKE